MIEATDVAQSRDLALQHGDVPTISEQIHGDSAEFQLSQRARTFRTWHKSPLSIPLDTFNTSMDLVFSCLRLADRCRLFYPRILSQLVDKREPPGYLSRFLVQGGFGYTECLKISRANLNMSLVANIGEIHESEKCDD